MSKTKPTDLAASVRQRLTNLARVRQEDFQLVLTRYATERFLYRLSRSKHAGNFVLKGAMLFQIWNKAPHRPTRDLDLLATGEPSIEGFEEMHREVFQESVEADGLNFDAASIRGEQIKEEDEYQGIRIRGIAKLANIRIPLQVDVGFGDAVTPRPLKIEFPTLLEFPAPTLLAYNRETVVAEKFQAMVVLGIANSRMKDFFDIWSLARDFEFDGSSLACAIAATFKRRATALPGETPLALRPEFSADAGKQMQWKAFLRKGGLVEGGASLANVQALLRDFLVPILAALRSEASVPQRWPAAGPWQLGPN